MSAKRHLYKSFLFYFILISISLLSIEGCQRGNSSGGYKTVDGTQIYYKIMGSGSPIIIIHDKPLLNHSYLMRPFSRLAKHHKLIFYDQRLCGHSSADVQKDSITLQNYVNDIEGLRTSLHLGDVDLLGHGWGGLLAMKYAIAHPKHIKKLVLADPMPARAREWQEQEIVLQSRTSVAYRKAKERILSSEATRVMSPPTIKKLQLLSFSKQFHDSSFVDSLHLYIPDDYAKRTRLFGYMMPELQHYNLYPKLKGMDIPTLILYGSDEPSLKLSGHKMQKAISQSKLVVIKDSGHFPFIEQPGQFFNAVEKFLK